MIDVAPTPTPARSTFTPDATLPLPTFLHAITQAYAVGDAPRGEQLFLAALDEQAPWDMVCAAAAQGIAARHAEQSRA